MEPDPDRDPTDINNKLDSNYTAESIENGNTIVIKVNFANPEEVSMAAAYDRLKVSIDRSEFKNAFLIVGDSKNLIELPADTEIETTINLPLQMPNEEFLVEA